PVDGIVIHHTAGRPTIDSLLATYRKSGNPAQFLIDRAGRIYQVVKTGSTGNQILPDIKTGLSNKNTIGIEVSAKHDSECLPIQIDAARRLVRYLTEDPEASPWLATGLNSGQVYGHAEVNPGHKERDEGATIADAIRWAYPSATVGAGISAPSVGSTGAPAFR